MSKDEQPKQPTEKAKEPAAPAPEQKADSQPPQQPLPAPQDLQVKDTKVFGITGLQKEVLANYLNVQSLNQFNLRAYLQLLAESQWGVKSDQLTRFGLNLEQNQITIEFLEPKQGASEKPAEGGVEAAPPAPAQ